MLRFCVILSAGRGRSSTRQSVSMLSNCLHRNHMKRGFDNEFIIQRNTDGRSRWYNAGKQLGNAG